MPYSYFPLLKTRTSELEALKHIDPKFFGVILPIFELTRSRRSPKSNPNASVFKNIEEIHRIMKRQPFILDLTSIPSFSSAEIDMLTLESNGYENWRKFLNDIKKNYQLRFIPCIIYNPFTLEDVKTQIIELIAEFPFIAFRIPASKYDEHIDNVVRILDGHLDKLIIIYDLETTIPDNVPPNVITYSQKFKVIITGSSFPSSFKLKNGQKRSIDSNHPEKMWNIMDSIQKYGAYYSDYASICAVVYDDRAGQWRARIDFINKGGYIYYKEPAPTEGRASSFYTDLALKVVHDSSYSTLNCWGDHQIEDASQGNPAKSAPSFWISVRVNLYINYMVHHFRSKMNELNVLDI